LIYLIVSDPLLLAIFILASITFSLKHKCDPDKNLISIPLLLEAISQYFSFICRQNSRSSGTTKFALSVTKFNQFCRCLLYLGADSMKEQVGLSIRNQSATDYVFEPAPA